MLFEKKMLHRFSNITSDYLILNCKSSIDALQIKQADLKLLEI